MGKTALFWDFYMKANQVYIKNLNFVKKISWKNTSYLLKFAAEFRLSLEAYRSLRSRSVTLFLMNLENLNHFLSLLKKKLCAVRAVSSLFLRLLLIVQLFWGPRSRHFFCRKKINKKRADVFLI